MLTIRKEQNDSLSQYMLRSFEDRMILHLKTNFANEIKALQETDLRTFIQSGIKRSKEYNIILEDDVRRYLEFMAMYGHDFDINPKTAWAGKILSTENGDGTLKMDMIDEQELSILREQR